MNEGQRLVYDGYEVCLYPLEYVNITAGPWAANHTVSGVANSGLWDNGWYQNQVRALYAPVTMRCVRSYSSGYENGHTQFWVSENPVWCPGYDTPVYISMMVSHSNTLYYGVGSVVNQGTHFYDTGNYGVGGYHVHFGLAVGLYETFPTGYNSYVGFNIWYSPAAPNSIADIFYLTDEQFVGSGGDGGQSWTRWDGPKKIKNYIYLALWKLKNRRKHVEIKQTTQ